MVHRPAVRPPRAAPLEWQAGRTLAALLPQPQPLRRELPAMQQPPPRPFQLILQLELLQGLRLPLRRLLPPPRLLPARPRLLAQAPH